MDSAKSKALSRELESYIIEIDKVLKNCNENNYHSTPQTALPS